MVYVRERRRNDVVISMSSGCSQTALCCVWEEHIGKRNDEMLLQSLVTCIGCTPQATPLQHWSKTNSFHVKRDYLSGRSGIPPACCWKPHPLQKDLGMFLSTVRVSVFPLQTVHGAVLVDRSWNLTQHRYIDGPLAYVTFEYSVLCKMEYSGHQNLIGRDFFYYQPQKLTT